MMKHRINKMAAIFIATMFALSGLGVAYAAWTDTLTIDGTVDTGDLCLKWREFADENPHITQLDVGPDWHCTDGMEEVWPDPELKDVGSTTFTWYDTDHKIIIMTVDNAYPCYYNHVSTHIVACADTIPLKIWKLVYTFTNTATDYQEIVEVFTHDQTVYFHGESGGLPVFEINWGNHFGTQMHGGDKIDVSFEFHLLQPAEQNHVYTIMIEVVGIQWNKLP